MDDLDEKDLEWLLDSVREGELVEAQKLVLALQEKAAWAALISELKILSIQAGGTVAQVAIPLIAAAIKAAL